MGFSKVLAAASGLAAVANGHMLMSTPAIATSPAADNSPLSSSNFPCQLTSGGTLAGETTSMALGSDQPLEFIGQSVHGGGSCQVSITYDENPTADSTWKVITSMEGGCPARNTEGNLGDDTSATAADPYTYNFTVPDDIPSGNAVLAWTWFNKVGNREMYMNCAMIELTGTSGDESNYDALPDMFVANIGGECSTTDGDLEFPDAGDVVQMPNGAITTTAYAVCGGSTITAGASATISVGIGSGATTTATAAAETTAAGGGIFASVGVSVGAGTSEATSTAVAAAPAATTSAASSSSSTTTSSTSSSSGSETAGSACDDEGDYVCVDSSSYLVCASGLWTSMPVAAGTECSGSGNSFAIVAAATEKHKMARALRWAKRSMPFLG